MGGVENRKRYRGSRDRELRSFAGSPQRFGWCLGNALRCARNATRFYDDRTIHIRTSAAIALRALLFCRRRRFVALQLEDREFANQRRWRQRSRNDMFNPRLNFRFVGVSGGGGAFRRVASSPVSTLFPRPTDCFVLSHSLTNFFGTSSSSSSSPQN